jgi:hypothetical protein
VYSESAKLRYFRLEEVKELPSRRARWRATLAAMAAMTLGSMGRRRMEEDPESVGWRRDPWVSSVHSSLVHIDLDPFYCH